MNSDLIKKLSDQARSSIPEDQYSVTEWVDQYNERLTKLVIEECIELCEQGTKTQTSSAGAALLIKQHFDIHND